MDDIIKVVKQEVALDGLAGTSMDKLWCYVELAQNRSRQQIYQQEEEGSPTSVDDAFKTYIWPYLIKYCDLSFKQGDVVVYDDQQPNSSSSSFFAQMFDEVINQYPQLIAHASVAAINKELFGRKEGNSKITNSQKTMFILQLVSRARGNGITQVQLTRQSNIDPRSTFHFLKVIDKEGLVVRQTTFEDGHTTNLWTLRQFAQRPAKSISTTNSLPTGSQNAEGPAENGNSGDNMNVLVRSRLRQRISDRLEKNSGSYMFVEDLMEEMEMDLCNPKQRKYFNQSLRHLIELGCLEHNMILARDQSISDEMLKRLEGAGWLTDGLSVEEKNVLGLLRSRRKSGLKDGYCYRRGVRFIKPYKENRRVRASIGVPLQTTESGSIVEIMDDGDGDTDSDNDSDSDDDGGMDIEVLKERDELKYMLSNPLVQMGRLDNLPLLAQLVRLIAIAGSHGLVSRSLQYLTDTHDFKLISRSMNRLEKTPIWAADGCMAGIYSNEQIRAENSDQQQEMLIYSAEEFMGREHRKRYFVNPLAADLIPSFTTETAAGQQQLEDSPENASTDMVQVESAVRSLLDDEGSSMDVLEQADSPNAATSAIETTVVESPVSATLTSPPPGVDERANSYGRIEDIYEEANRRRVPLNNIIRERIILKMLEDEQAFECHPEKIRKLDTAMKEYILSNRGSPVVTPTLVNTITRSNTDKRTIMRIIRSLEASGKLQCQSMNSMIRATGNSGSKELLYDTIILIHRSVDPDDPIVNTIVDDRKSSFVVRSAANIEFAPKKTSQVPIVRTERGQRRDQMNAEKRRRVVEVSSDLTNTPKEGEEEEPPAKWRRLETRVEIVDSTDQVTPVLNQDAFWMGIHTRLHHLPSRNLILKNLHAYLVDNLPKQQDRADVFPNYTFHNPYLFHGLPLEMFLQVTNGVDNFPGLEDYIRYGNLPDEPSVATSRPEDIENRLATPVDQLPDTIFSLLFVSLHRVRCRFQWYIYCMFMLQLIYPIDKALDLANTANPPNSTSVFRCAPKCKNRSMNMGYQLIGKTRILNQAGYKKANDPLVKLGEKGTDLTVNYIEGGREYNVLDDDDLCRYWIDLQTHTTSRKMSFERTSPLVSFKVRANWLINVSMTKAQAESLERYFHEREHNILPLGDTEKLESAANFAGTTLEVAQRYYEGKRGLKGYKRTTLSESRKMERRALREQQKSEEEKKKAEDRVEETKEKTKKEKGGNEKEHDVNRVWSMEDSQKLIAYIVVAYHHKLERPGISTFSYGELLFPRRIVEEKVGNLGKRLNSRWKSMKGLKYYVALKVKLEVLWPFAYRAAMDRGELPELEEYHTINKDDIKIETDYLYEFIRSGRVGELMQTYGDEIKASEAYENIEEDVDVFGPLPEVNERCDPKKTRSLMVPLEIHERRRAKERKEREEAAAHADESVEPDKHEETKKPGATKKGKEKKKKKEQVPHYLPGTLKGKSHLYAIRAWNSSRSLQSVKHDFIEDAFAERIKHSSRGDRTAWHKSVTTHIGWECMSDYSCPVTTTVRFSDSGQSAEEADGDDGISSSRQLVVAKAAEHIPYTDSLSTEYPFERELDGNTLIKKLQELALGTDPMEVDQEPNTSETDDDNNNSSSSNEGDPQQTYVEMAVLQTLLLNMIMTPDDQFSKDVSWRLFSGKTDASERVIKRLTRHSMVAKLSNMSVLVGLKMPSGDSQSLSVSVLTEALDKMVVSYETTGMTRIDQAPYTSDDHHLTLSANLIAAAEIRRVPGRGFALHDRFRKILLPAIPERFESSQLASGGFGSELHYDTALSVAEFEQMCRWVARGKLWLRPNYQQEPDTSSGDSLLWMVNTQQATDPQSLLGFVLNVVDGQITEDSGGSLPKEQPICASFSDLAMGMVTGLVGELGIMGASENELLSLIQILLANLDVDGSSSLPPDVLEALTDKEQLQSMLQQLVKDQKLFEVGSSDRRFVSPDNFHKYWVLAVDEHTLLKPYLGQSLSGSINKVYELAVISSLVSRIIENPGIPESALMRRFFAPYIPRRDISWYLGLLVRLGIVVSEKIALDRLLVSTHYHMSKKHPGILTKLSDL